MHSFCLGRAGNLMRLSDQLHRSIESSQWMGWLNVHDSDSMVRCIPFNEYMNHCLYDEQAGYYKSGKVRIGKKGDFYTSSGIGSVMGEMTADYAFSLAGVMEGCHDIIEWGGGTGELAGQLLDRWNSSQPEWAAQLKYWFIEDNPEHVAAAQNRLSAAAGSITVNCLSSVEALSCRWDKALVIANELLDAFPVHRVVCQGGRLWELGVASDRQAGFCYCYMPFNSLAVAASLEQSEIRLLEGQETEVNLAACQWLAAASRQIGAGWMILIDYGDTADELTAPHRMKGTLLCYSGHRTHDNPFRHPGEEDLTAHVNFSSLLHQAGKLDMETLFYGSQQQFLLKQGIMTELADHEATDPFSGAARRNRSIRELLLGGMSETFKVLTLAKRDR
ncbi:SAM-dependent methyltransferase [Paenibacillaceae bacterium]|nr:SAM-dependent methyltransferase [Paenibacillaceae bacterium]